VEELPAVETIDDGSPTPDPIASAAPGAPGPAGDENPNRRPTILVLVGVALVVTLGGWMIRSQADTDAQLDVGQQTAFEDIIGIRVLRVVMTAGGGLVEFQYQVLDPDKSLAVHDDEARPQLIDEESGTVVAIPFHDHKTRELHTAVTYRELFMNGDGVLDRGSKVTLRVGDAQIEHIKVG